MLADRGEQCPLAGYSLERVCATVLKRNAGSVHEILDCARHEHLTCLRKGSDPRPDVDGDSTDVVAPQFALASVQTTPNVDAQLRHSLGERGGASERAGRPVERGQKSIAGVFDFAALETSDLGPGELIVSL